MNRIKRIGIIGCAAISATALVWLLVFVSGFGTVAVAAPQVDVAQDGLVITKTVSPETGVTLGIEVLYTIEIANHGDAAASVGVSDTLPSQVEFGGWVEGEGTLVLPNIYWGPYILAVGESRTLAFTATLKNLTAFLPVTNEACVATLTDRVCDTAVFEMGGFRLYMPILMKGATGTLGSLRILTP